MISKDDPADVFWKDEPHLRTLLGRVETLPARLPKKNTGWVDTREII